MAVTCAWCFYVKGKEYVYLKSEGVVDSLLSNAVMIDFDCKAAGS